MMTQDTDTSELQPFCPSTALLHVCVSLRKPAEVEWMDWGDTIGRIGMSDNSEQRSDGNDMLG